MDLENDENVDITSECREGISAWEQSDLDLYLDLVTPPELMEPLTEGESGTSEDMLAATLHCDQSDPSRSCSETTFSDVNHMKLLSRFNLDYFEKHLQKVEEEGNGWVHLLPPSLNNMAHTKKSALLDVEKASFEDIWGGDQPLDRPREQLPRALLKRAFFVKRPEEPLPMPLYSSGNSAAILKSVGPKKKKSTPSTQWKLQKRPMEVHEDIPRYELQELLRGINAKLSKNKFGRARNPFIEVITRGNCVSKGIPEYFKFVSDPMNLKWTKERISRGAYTNLTDYMADIELIAANAQKFNRPGEATYIAASTLREALVKELKRAGFIIENAEAVKDSNAEAEGGEPEAKKRKLENKST